MKNWVTDSTDNIPHQDGIKEHLTDLQAAKTWIMHPKRTRHRADGTYISENRPHYTSKLPKLKLRLKDLDNTAKIMPDYLYEPEPDPVHEPNTNKVKGRALFEYSPNFCGRKTGRLVMEDGGVQPQDGLEPGPGGPFEFDFGPAEVKITT